MPSAQRKAVATGDEMLVGAAKQVSARATDHEWCRIPTAVRQSHAWKRFWFLSRCRGDRPRGRCLRSARLSGSRR